MSRQQKYEPLAQHDEVIILDPMTSTTSYNYNSATPNSVPSSITPSVISHASPPPSFHTHSSPGTPRPQHSFPEHQWASINAGVMSGRILGRDGGEGGGPPSSETEVGGIATSNDALATIKGLKQRVEWLEESMGRLLLEKERRKDKDEDDNNTLPPHDRNNCCVSFTDMSPDLERAVLANRQNCFVAYNGSSRSLEKRKDQRILLGALLVLAAMICATIATIVIAHERRKEAVGS